MKRKILTFIMASTLCFSNTAFTFALETGDTPSEIISYSGYTEEGVYYTVTETKTINKNNNFLRVSMPLEVEQVVTYHNVNSNTYSPPSTYYFNGYLGGNGNHKGTLNLSYYSFEGVFTNANCIATYKGIVNGQS